MSIEEKRFTVSGMHCAACSSRIERVIGSQPGVELAAVNLAAENMICRFDSDAVSVDEIVERVAGLGFGLKEDASNEIAIEFNISGMHCASCSTRIEKVVGGLEGVISADVNLATEKAQVCYDNVSTTPRQIREAIENLGFSAARASGSSDEFSKKRLESQQRLAQMKQRLMVMLFFAAILLYVSMGEMIGLPLPSFLVPQDHPFLFGFLQFCLVLPIIYFGRNFYLNGFPALFRRAPNMDSLIAVGTGAAFVYSTWGLICIAAGINPQSWVMNLYFESTGILVALVSLGKYLENRSKSHTSDAISQLIQLQPDTACLVEGDKQQIIPTDEIEVGDILLVKQGERIPVDGIVAKGTSTIDEAMLTGESLPVDKNEGDKVYGGTFAISGLLQIETTQTGEDTVLSRIVKMVQDAQGSKAPIASLADRISYYFVPVVMVIALLTGISWYLIGDAGFSLSLKFFISVLVIACPCAMGLATPTSIMVGTGRGAQLGILIKSGEALQRSEQIDTIVFDKTGTLTAGTPEVTDYLCLTENETEQEILCLAASAERASEHPLGEAIVRFAEKNGCQLTQPDHLTAVDGAGIMVVIDNRKVMVGNKRMLDQNEISIPAVAQQSDTLSHAGKTLLYVAIDRECVGLLAIADQLRPEACDSIAALKDKGYQLVMLTGDHPDTARVIAEKAGIAEVISQVMPDEKQDRISTLQDQGRVVAMVGDGINDAPALAQADVGIAMGSGTDIAIESGDIVIVNGKLGKVMSALSLSRAVMKNIRQNLFWAFIYNIIGIPIAAGLLVLFGGPGLNPMFAGAAMAASSVSVVSNALRLRFFNG